MKPANKDCRSVALPGSVSGRNGGNQLRTRKQSAGRWSGSRRIRDLDLSAIDSIGKEKCQGSVWSFEQIQVFERRIVYQVGRFVAFNQVNVFEVSESNRFRFF